MKRIPHWTVWAPIVSLVLLAATWGSKPGTPVLVVVGIILATAVLAAVHHAEVVAHRVGEPYGSLVLAVAVTVIEVALIVTLMVAGGKDTATLARDTVFAAVMITVNGIVGISLLTATLRGGVATFNAEGTATALATVATLATLTLVLPTFTTSRPGAGVLRLAARVRRRRLARALRAVRVHPDDPPPRLLRVRRAAARTSTRRRRPTAPRSSASACWWSRWSPWSGWPRSSRRRSRTRWSPPARRTRRSAS